MKIEDNVIEGAVIMGKNDITQGDANITEITPN
jgi:hypothetical protein